MRKVVEAGAAVQRVQTQLCCCICTDSLDPEARCTWPPMMQASGCSAWRCVQ